MQPKLYVEWPSKGKPLVRSLALEDCVVKLIDAIEDKHKASRELLELGLTDDDSEIHRRLDEACIRIEAIAEVIGATAVQFGWRKEKKDAPSA